MKKIITILFISAFVLALVSCNTKTGADKDLENAKESVDKSVDKTKEGVENVKDSWNDTKDAVDKKNGYYQSKCKERRQRYKGRC